MAGPCLCSCVRYSIDPGPRIGQQSTCRPSTADHQPHCHCPSVSSNSGLPVRYRLEEIPPPSPLPPPSPPPSPPPPPPPSPSPPPLLLPSVRSGTCRAHAEHAGVFPRRNSPVTPAGVHQSDGFQSCDVRCAAWMFCFFRLPVVSFVVSRT